MRTQGRRDVTKGRSQRELEVLDRVVRIALDLDGVVLHQGAKAGQASGAQHHLDFGRQRPGRKTPILFMGIMFRTDGKEWERRSEIPAADVVRVYLKISVPAAEQSDWADLFHDDDGLKPDAEWRYVEIPDRIDVAGDELLDLVEDAYFAVAGI